MSSLQLLENQWQLKVNKNFDYKNNHYLGRFTSPFIVAFIQANNVEPGWRQGGQIAQKIPFQSIHAYGEFKKIELEALTLLEFPSLTQGNYDLYYFPLNRLDWVNLKIWEYQGALANRDTTELIDVLENQVTVNAVVKEGKLDCSELVDKLELIQTKLLSQSSSVEEDFYLVEPDFMPPGYY